MVHVHFRRNSHTLTLGELPLVVGLLFCSPGDVVLGMGHRRRASCSLLNRESPARSASSSTSPSSAITAGIAGTVFHAVTGDGAALGPLVWVAAALAVLLAVAVSVVLVDAAMWLSGDRIEPRKLGVMVAMSTCCRGHQHEPRARGGHGRRRRTPRAIVLLVAPVLAIFLAYRAHLAERRQAANLQFLHEASRTLSTASNAAAGIAGMLAMTLENFRGEVAEVCLFPADGEGEGSRISVGGPRGLEVMEPLDERVVRELTELMDRDSAARLVTPEDGGRRARRPPAATRRPERDARIAARSAPHDRDGDGRRPAATSAVSSIASEIKLFDTLAHQTGAAVGQDSLTTKVDELRELQVELEHQAFHDPLTGLANRLLFMNRVEFVLQRRTGNAAVIYLDLDNFKPINDTHGHEAGDAVLKAAGDRLHGLAAPRRHRRAARRRRVRGAARGHPRGAHRRGRRPHRRQSLAAARRSATSS